MKVELFQHLFYLFNSWQREILAMEGKSVLPRHRALFVYVRTRIVTGPVLELGRPVLELGRSSPHTGTVPRRGAPYWNWIQDRGFVPKWGAQCWNWATKL